jgi:hypothetical protein
MLAPWLLTLGSGVIASRFHPTFGVAPVLAAVLCAALFLRPRHLWIIGLGGMLLRDLLLGLSLFTLVRLVAIALVVAAVQAMRVRPTLRSLLTALVVSSPVFHLTLAAGNWLTGTCGVWPRTAEGLAQSVATSYPYFQRSFLCDLLFVSLFLSVASAGAYLWPSRKPVRAGAR